MPRYLHYLVVLVRILVDKSFAQPVGDHGLSGDSGQPRIIFPLPNQPKYNFWDSVNVTYWSPWSGGVNLTANCWLDTVDEDPFNEVTDCLGTSLFCSPCTPRRPTCLRSPNANGCLGPSNGSHQFDQVGFAYKGCVTYPTQCWFALGPYEDEDVPENVSTTTYVGYAMATVTTGGNFSMISNTAIPPTTYTKRPPPDAWTKLSTREQAGILTGVYLTLLGSLVGAMATMRERSRWLEHPSNPVHQGIFVTEPDGNICYKPEKRQEHDSGRAVSFHFRGLLSVDATSSHPLLSGTGVQP